MSLEEMKEAKGERKGLCGLEVVMVSRTGGTDNDCRGKGKHRGKGRGLISRKRCPCWREASKDVEMLELRNLPIIRSWWGMRCSLFAAKLIKTFKGMTVI